MTGGRPLACLLAVLGALACARRTEIIGRVIDGGLPPEPVVDASADRDQTAGGEAGEEPALPLCPPPEAPPQVPAPPWNCQSPATGCWRNASIDPGVFSAPPRTGEARPPVISYPLPGSVHPTNLGRLTVQFRRATVEQTSFRIRLQAAGSSYELFVPFTVPTNAATPIDGQLESLHVIDEPFWRYIAQQHPDGTLALTVAAHDGVLNVVDVSAPVAIRFAGPVEGVLHHLAMAGDQTPPGIRRHLLGSLRAQTLVQPGVAPYTADCVSCHSVSRAGGVLAFSSTLDFNFTLARTDRLAQPIVLPGAQADFLAVAPAVDPRGRYVVARSADDLSLGLFSSADGQRLQRLDVTALGGRIDYPQWSPDGSALVATRVVPPDQAGDRRSARQGELVILPVVDGQLQAPRRLLAEADQAFSYPGWSPDGQWVAFTSSPAGMETMTTAETRLRLIGRNGRPVFELGGPGAGARWPRFVPTGLAGCRTLFLAFHSHRDYGSLRRNPPHGDPGRFAQLWLSAVELDRLPGDPSSPPVWLPFQDHLQRNLLPAFSDIVACSPGGTGCGPGARCDGARSPARCVPD